MAETFGMRFRAWRVSTPDPETGRAISQAKLAETLLCSLSAVRKYEKAHRLPHPLIKREILRLWPDFFNRMPARYMGR